MTNLLNKVKNPKMGLIVSLPYNSYDLAKAAWENGADLIKVHTNVWHRASDNVFGTLEENYEVFKKILDESPIPVGIVIADDAFVVEKDIQKVVEMGFSFVSLYAHNYPISLDKEIKVYKFLAIDYTYSLDEVKLLTNTHGDFLEMSVCLPESYGARLNIRDLEKYRELTLHSNIPTILPTQHYVLPTDILSLYQAGIRAIMIGAIVTTKEKKKFIETIQSFRKAIDQL